MKKATKILAMVMAAAILCCVLVSCGNTLKGSYKSEGLVTETTYTFDGDSVKFVKGVGALAVTLEGTYEIKDDKITLTFTEGADYSGEFDFEKGNDYIKIGKTTYTLVD